MGARVQGGRQVRAATARRAPASDWRLPRRLCLGHWVIALAGRNREAAGAGDCPCGEFWVAGQDFPHRRSGSPPEDRHCSVDFPQLPL